MLPSVHVQRVFLKAFQVDYFEGDMMGALEVDLGAIPASKASFQREAKRHQRSPG